MKRILALVFALTACMVLAVGCAASSSNASSATSSATSAAKSSSAASSQAQSSSTASTTATSEEAPTASEVVPESEWGTLFAVFGDEAVAFGQRVQSELPASAFAEYDGVASGEPIEFTDPGQIRALFNALAQSNAVEGADEIRTEYYGEGMDEEQLRHIWQRYYRASEHKRSVVGTGLGLSIVQNVLSRHSAEFGVDSTVGQGSTFWFALPFAKGDD